jgi:methionyl-tRNA formyltransferase
MGGSGVTEGRSLRLALFGDGAWAADTLSRLHDAGHRVAVAVLRERPSDGSLGDVCARAGVPVLAPADASAPSFLGALRGHAPDLLLSVSYNQILKKAALDAAPLGAVNFHAGKLPFYRGRNVINWAIINGETEIGLTSHHVDLGVDTGDIILQRMLPIAWADTYGDVLARVVAALPGLAVDTVNAIADGSATRCAQAHLPGTYFGGRENGDEWLDWSDTSEHLHNKVRAITHPGPGARTMMGDRELTIWRAYFDRNWPRYIATPGQVVGRERGRGVLVKTGDSTLLVQEVQIADEAPCVPAWRIGTRLGVNVTAALRAAQDRLAALEHRRS